MMFHLRFRPRGVPILLMVALLALVLSSCGGGRHVGSTGKSLVLVTFGHVPAAFVEDSSSMSNLVRLAEASGTELRRVVPPAGAAEAARALFGDVRASFQGYDTAAFLADPALLAAASAFATSAVPGRALSSGVRLHPDPVRPVPFEDIRLGNVVTEAALAWLSARAGLPPPTRKSAKKESATATPEPKPSPALKAPVFLWVHLADPAFRDSPERIRVAGVNRNPEIAFMDLQLGRIAGFLSENGLAEKVVLAAACIEGAPSRPDEAESGEWTRLALPRVIPEAAAALLPAAAASADLPAPAPVRPGEGLLYRLQHPSPADTNLVADCEAWRDAHPDDPEALCWLGVAQGHSKQFAAAAASHGKALQLEPKSPFRMSNYGLALLATGDVLKSIDNLENAFLAEPDTTLYRNNLASVLLRTGTTLAAKGADAEAMQCFSRVVFLQPQNPQAHFVMGRHHEKMHRLPLARACYRKALDIQPRFKPARDALDALDKKSGTTPPPAP